MKHFCEKNNQLFNESKIKRVFESRLKRYNISISLFKKNCKTVNVINCKIFKNGAAAMYDLFNNNILLHDSDYKDYIWHELLHMSSTVRRGEVIYSGVSAVDLSGYRIGSGFNEGLTVFIDLMFFKGITKEHDVKSDTYKIEKQLCDMLYDILGVHLLDFYFSADFYGLYNLLVSFNGTRKTNKFYNAFDTICYESYYSENFDEVRVKKIFSAYKYAYYYLVEFLIKKIRFNYENGDINEKSYKNILNKCDEYFKDVSLISKNGKMLEISKEKVRKLIQKNISSI